MDMEWSSTVGVPLKTDASFNLPLTWILKRVLELYHLVIPSYNQKKSRIMVVTFNTKSSYVSYTEGKYHISPKDYCLYTVHTTGTL